MPTTIKPKSNDVGELVELLAANKAAAVERVESIRNSVVIDGKPVPVAELAEALREAGQAPEDFQRACDWLRRRIDDASVAADLPSLREQVAEHDRKIEAAQAAFDELMPTLYRAKGDADDEIEGAERAERRLQKSRPSWLSEALDKISREVRVAERTLAEPVPEIESTAQGKRYELSSEARERRLRRRNEILRRKSQAERTLGRLEPIVAAIRALALQPLPSRDDLRAILDAKASAAVEVDTDAADDGDDTYIGDDDE